VRLAIWDHRFQKRYTFIILLILFLTGTCQHTPGIYTRSVHGVFSIQESRFSNRSFILVHELISTFISSSRNIYDHKVYILRYRNTGTYLAPFSSASTSKMNLYFFSESHFYKLAAFSRSLGIDSYNFNAKLVFDPNWRSNFFISIKPFLMKYLTEKRYNMGLENQKYLSSWLKEAEDHF